MTVTTSAEQVRKRRRTTLRRTLGSLRIFILGNLAGICTAGIFWPHGVSQVTARWLCIPIIIVGPGPIFLDLVYPKWRKLLQKGDT
jgi:hypothetical protein